MSNHTPGPWSYSTSNEGWGYTINIHQSDNAEYTPHWSDVAFCTCKGERQEIQEANARLIAAAPELHAELLKLSDDLRSHTKDGLGATAETLAVWESRVLAAIAKATGGQS